MSTPAVTPNPDKLSGGDMSALVETYQHLKQANDPRADKVGSFIRATVSSGNAEPLEPGNPEHAGFWKSLGSDLWNMVPSAPHSVGEAASMAGKNILTASTLGMSNMPQLLQSAVQRHQQGKGALYTAGAAEAEGLGANVQGMEKSADEGDPGGVLGHAAAVPAVLAATEGARALAPAARAVIDKTLPARQAVAEGTITRLIKPMKNDVTFGKDPAGAVVREGITANSLEDLGDKVYAKTREVGQQIDQALQTPQAQAQTIDASKALAPIDQAKFEALRTGNKGLFDRLNELKTQITMNWQEDPATGSIKPVSAKNLQMTPYEATRLKRDVGDLTRWTGNDPFEDDLNAVKGKVFGALKDQVNQAVPDVAGLNKRYSDLVSAGKAVERRVPIAARSSEWSLGDIGTTMAAAHYGGPAAVAAVAGKKVLGSTFFKTRLANLLAGPNQ